jgi:predicted small lipoprotein YifL
MRLTLLLALLTLAACGDKDENTFGASDDTGTSAVDDTGGDEGDDTDVGDDTGGSGGDDTDIGGDDTSGGGDDTDTGLAECNTDNEDCGPGTCGGDGPTMLPGADCIACHSPGNFEEDEDDAFWSLAGTVFEDLLGSDGASGVTVRVTDADGKVVTLESNSAGNFYTTSSVTFPISAEVERDGVVKEMGTQPTTGACNSCHACEGSAGGKLYAP